MRALSLWQPWASLWAAGIKRNETRGRLTHVRGPVAIHAAKLTASELYERIGPAEYVRLGELCRTFVIGWIGDLPRGCVVGTVEIVDCVSVILPMHTSEMTVYGTPFGPGSLEGSCGDYSPGRFAWIGRNHVVVEPLPWKGSQGFFDVPADLLHEARPEATS